MKKIVLTGGPCAGKTSVLDTLRFEFADKALVVPEVATLLLSGGFPVPGKDIEWTPAWQKAFQSAVLPVQIQLEDAYAIKAEQKGINLLICDRGLLDGGAYTPGGQSEFCKIYDVDLQEALGRYAAVLHLESLATGKPELYGKANNTNRFEGLEEAVHLEQATRDAWQGHPHWTLLNCEQGIERKISTAITVVLSLLE